MIFLIEYDRANGRLAGMQSFEDSQLELAQDAYLELELDLHRRKTPHEVVLLEAASEEALRKTHGRYFDTLEQLFARLKAI